MIHKILVGPETDIQDLKKEVRKRLMTGGAVVRLRDGLGSEDLEKIIETYCPNVERHGVQASVLIEVAKSDKLSREMGEKLLLLGLPEIENVIKEKYA